MDNLMKTGEFADLCRTTKETLRHYERIGILRPIMRERNGYRMYSYVQTVDFALISALQSAGLSLAGIHDFLAYPGTTQLQDLLGEQIQAIQRERDELARKQRVLEDALALSAELDSWLVSSAIRIAPGGNRWRISTCTEERFIETPVPYAQDRENEFMAAAVEHMRFCEQQGWAATFQEAYRYDAAHVAAHEYGAGMHALTRIAPDARAERMHVKPAGAYLEWLHRIDLSSLAEDPLSGDAQNNTQEERGGTDDKPVENALFAAYDAMLDFACRQGITLTGDLYDTVLSLYSGSITDTIYTKISMRIELA